MRKYNYIVVICGFVESVMTRRILNILNKNILIIKRVKVFIYEFYFLSLSKNYIYFRKEKLNETSINL